MSWRNVIGCLLLALSNACDASAQTCYGGFCYPQQPTSRDARYVTPLAPQASLQHAAHCRIFVGDGTVGSGTLIARNDTTGLVLTCSHLFDAAASNIVVAFADGGRFGANLIDRDPANDLAAVVIKRPKVEPVTVNDSEPTGVLTACGYGSTGAFRPASGPIAGMAQAVGATYPSVKITSAVRPGDSGGGVLDGAGRLVGVVWGCRDGETYLTCGRPLRQFLDRVWQGRPNRTIADATTPQTPTVDSQAWRDNVDARIAALDANKQDRGDYLRVGDLNGYARSTDLPAMDSIHQRIEERIAELRPGLLSGMSFGKLVAGALGLSSPVALAVTVAGGLAGRRLKSRESRDKSRGPETHSGSRPSTLDSRPFPIAVDSPPPPQQTVPETHYVPFEKDDFARAHQWASAQVARKYPGAAELLTTLDSLIRQQLAGASK